MGAFEDYIYKRVCESREFFEAYVRERVETALLEHKIKNLPALKNSLYDPVWETYGDKSCPDCNKNSLLIGKAPAWGPFPGLVRCSACSYNDSVVGYESKVVEKPRSSFSLNVLK